MNNLRIWAAYGLLLPLLPIIAWQGKRARLNTLRLPEAKGDKRLAGGEQTLLHLGESTVAGVGVDQLHQGLTGQLLRQLNVGNQGYCAQIQGANGARMSDVNEWPRQSEAPDMLLITMGVNDTVAFTSLDTWQQQVLNCVEKFSADHSRVIFTSVPRMQQFPALPNPLCWLLGLRAAQLNIRLKRLCEQYGWHFIQADLPIKSEWMAADGYHPNATGYQQWAALIAHQLLNSEAM